MSANVEKTDYISAICRWRHISGYRKRHIINNSLDLSESGIQVVEYRIGVPSEYALSGKSLLFFSDLHYDNRTGSAGVYIDILKRISPDWIVFGGDLATYACSIEAGFEWLGEISANFADIPKVAVPGNWDRRRKLWFPQHIWRDNYKRCGFNWLVNEEIILDGIRFYGVDDARLGRPLIETDRFDKEYFNCIVSHSVEPVVDSLNNSDLPGNNLLLCGHSHGGQVRVPFFGAVLTSSKYWKLFEYGRYKKRNSETDLIMTSGLGTSRFPFRIFCPPELVVIRFEDF
jgi:predicted MPP superfamily phosphohydrolase